MVMLLRIAIKLNIAILFSGIQQNIKIAIFINGLIVLRDFIGNLNLNSKNLCLILIKKLVY